MKHGTALICVAALYLECLKFSHGFSVPHNKAGFFLASRTFTRTTNRTSTSIYANKGVTIQYSASSLKHLEAVDLPPDYSRPWTKEKYIAISGAFFVGTVSFLFGSYAATALWGDDQVAIILGGIGTACGWYVFGGGEVMEAEKEITEKNGGYDSKLIADRPARLQTVLDDLATKQDIQIEQTSDRDLSTALDYIKLVHGNEYADMLKNKCEGTDRPIRFNPLYARTLIDENSYDAAVNAVQDWIDSVDAAIESGTRPRFSLSRPPGHHACKAKGMGGCLFNNAAIAAHYALSLKDVKNVAILDIDAHHGNGVAHCVQDEARIRYCSIHETKNGVKPFVEQKIPEDDPRSQDADDNGPLGNLCNINLNSGTGWDNGYQEGLVQIALPFLMKNEPDLLIVSAGFDALESDWSSGLMMRTEDYKKIGVELRNNFGNQVAMGLEGGYSFQDHALSNALIEFCSAWND